MTLPAEFFVSDDVHSREVELPDGKKHTMYFKEIKHSAWRKFAIAESSDDEDKKSEAQSNLIADSLVDEKGNPAITAEQAKNLKVSVMTALLMAIVDVNGRNEKNV